MAQNPVDPLGVVRDSVHAESSEGGVGNRGQLFEVVGLEKGPVRDAEQGRGQEEEEELVERIGLQVVLFVVNGLWRTLCRWKSSDLAVRHHRCSCEASMQHLPAKAEKILDDSQ